jgi:hypothetical protein
MASTDYDVIIAGTKAKLKRSEERDAFRKRFVRREIQQQIISQGEDTQLATRDDQVRMLQRSWSDGATWWKPMLRPDTIATYFRANNLDVWSQPGKVIPLNKLVLAQEDSDPSTGIGQREPWALDASGDLYTVGSSRTTDSSQRDVYKWDGSLFTRQTAYSSGVAHPERARHMIFDQKDGYFYILTTSSKLVRFNPSTAVSDVSWLTGFSLKNGSTILLAAQGGLMVYDGISIYQIDKSVPSATEIFDDGLGEDAINSAPAFNQTYFLYDQLQLAIATPEGIYYVKNTMSATGQRMAFIFRVRRDASGAWIGEPIGSLPVGDLAVGITYHLGEVVVSAVAGDSILGAIDLKVPINIYSFGQSMNVLGSVLGDADQIDELPFKFIHQSGVYLFMAGAKRIWVYDGARGGIHAMTTFNTEVTNSTLAMQMFSVYAGGGDSWVVRVQGIVGGGADELQSVLRIRKTSGDDPYTVTAFGDDETKYTLESNYFDFNLPFENKELSKIEIEHEAIDSGGNQEWTVQISVDDGAFTDRLVNSEANSTYKSVDLSGISGRRFRYKLIYQTKNTERVPLRGLLVSATSGESVAEYELLLDGEELLNVDNEIQDEKAFYDALSTIAATGTQVDFVDNMKSQDADVDSTDTVKVKVQGVEITKGKPGESAILVILREM